MIICVPVPAKGQEMEIRPDVAVMLFIVGYITNVKHVQLKSKRAFDSIGR